LQWSGLAGYITIHSPQKIVGNCLWSCLVLFFAEYNLSRKLVNLDLIGPKMLLVILEQIHFSRMGIKFSDTEEMEEKLKNLSELHIFLHDKGSFTFYE
jgi:hypothetical protein